MKKQPKQKRSQDVVNSVLEAATRILTNNRLKETSTNKIADVAGVGIGSLYDYFPNKDAIAIALVDQRIDKLMLDFKEILDTSEGTLDALIESCLDYIEVSFVKRRAFLHEIFLLAPQNGRMEAIYQARRKSIAVLEECLVQKYKKEPSWASKKSFFAMNAVMGSLEAYIILDEHNFPAESVKAELRNVLLGILKSSSSAED